MYRSSLRKETADKIKSLRKWYRDMIKNNPDAAIAILKKIGVIDNKQIQQRE